jgi:hypothetical protein
VDKTEAFMAKAYHEKGAFTTNFKKRKKGSLKVKLKQEILKNLAPHSSNKCLCAKMALISS